MKKHNGRLTPEQREKLEKESPFIQLFKGISSSKAKEGQSYTMKSSSRKTETTKNQLKKKASSRKYRKYKLD